MKRSLMQLLVCVLAVPVLSACGPEAEHETGSAATLDTSSQVEALRAEAREDSADGPRVPTRLVEAPGALGVSEVQGLGPERYGMVLIDRSGSMTATRSTGNSRCKDAKKQALLELDRLFDPMQFDRTHVAVWSFAGAIVTKHTIGYVDKATAVTAVTNLTDEGCSGGTPLADAMCWAIDDLSAKSPGESTNLYVATDGEENASTGACSGPWGDPTATPSSWQYKVYAKAVASLVKTSTDYWTGSLVLNLLPSDPQGATTLSCTSMVTCEDKLFSSLATVTGGEYRRAKDANTVYPCTSTASCPVPFSGTRGNTLAFNVINTNGANVNTANQAIYLRAGETLTVGTCGVSGASATGDTSMRLFGPGGLQVAANDDGCGLLSKITYVAPSTGTYQVRVGCFANNPCSGTAAYTIGSSFNFSAINTKDATTNTFNSKLYLRPGQRLQIGTCGVTGSSGTGDTLLRLFGPSVPSTQVAINDDACGGSLSNIVYAIPDTGGGESEIRVGCYANTSCSGTVSYLITDVNAP